MTPPRSLPRRLFDAVYGAYAALVFVTIIVGILSVCVLLLPGLRLRRRVAGALIHTALALCGMPLRVCGRSHLPEGAYMVVANHASYLDGLLMTAALPPQVSYVVKDDVADWPLVGRVLSRLGVVFIARDTVQMSARQTRALLKRLRAGEHVGIFPEGTFQRAPGLMPFKLGAFLLATRTQVPVVPVAIRGSRTCFGEGARLPRWAPLRVDILPPQATRDGIDAETLAARVRRAISDRIPEECETLATA